MPSSPEDTASTGETGRMLATLISNLPGFVYRCLNDESWTIRYISDRVEAITGFPSREYLNGARHFADVIHPEDRARVSREVSEGLTRAGRFEVVYRIVTAAGVVRWVRDHGCRVSCGEGGSSELEGFICDVTEERQAQSALVESVARYRELFLANPQPMWVYDLETLRFLAVNDAAVRHYGYTLEEFLGMTIADIRPSEDVPRLLENVSRVTHGIDEAGEWRHRRKDGSVIHVEITSHTILFDQRRAELVIAIDVTARRNAEDALRLQAAALNATISAMMITNCECIIEWVNPAWSALTGYRADEAVGQSHRILKPDAPGGAAYELLWRTVRAGRPAQAEVLSRRKDGSVYDEHQTITPIFDSAGQITHFIAVKKDISERRRAEQQIRKLASFPQLNPNPVLEFSADGTLSYANPAALTMAREVGAATIDELLPKEAPELVRASLADAQPRLRILSQFGGHTISWSFYPIAPEQTVHCYAGDISERLELENQLRQSQKMEAIGRLAGGIAHDFNNLLTVIRGNTSILQLNSLSPGERDEALAEIARASQRAGDLTRQLLAFSRRQRIELRSVELNEAVANASRMLQRMIGEDIRLQLSLAPEPLVVRADPGMLDQVLMNLAVNARDAMARGGQLSISTQLASVTSASGPGLADGSRRWVSLRVSDTGAGIAPEHLPHIFEPFFTTKSEGKGTGLGLATVFGIVQQHGGTVHVTSLPGAGSTFEILLPLDEALRATQLREDEADPPRGRGETILVVEDDEAVRRLTVRLLTSSGYRVIEAFDGHEALRLCAEKTLRIDLLITDMTMPRGMTGAELSRALQRDLPGLKTVYMSGYADAAARGDLELLQGRNFLQKPFSCVGMLECVRAQLDG